MSQRTDKVQKLAKQVLGEEIQNLKDPRIGFATVTTVRMTPDLRRARVFISVLGTPGEVAATMAGLESARTHLRFELGRQIRMKYLPELLFELDTGAEEAERLDELLNKIHETEPQEDES
ncbi:MAG: ribosome-binding factor [Actinomycetota bacterium]|nr:ribosome-binding factor [Actinomycetota bacterium]